MVCKLVIGNSIYLVDASRDLRADLGQRLGIAKRRGIPPPVSWAYYQEQEHVTLLTLRGSF